MNKTIEQQIDFPGSTASDLFEIFLDPEKHSAIHGGAKVIISKKEGSRFSLINGHLKGKNLVIVPDRIIVQSWRGDVWNKDDLDSILTLVFSDTEQGARIDMVHAFTPDQFTEHWEEVYWSPIRDYLSRNST